MLPVIILNAGRGSRLGALTDDRPKCLVKVAGRPFLDHQLDWLREQGVRRVILATGYRGEQVIAHVRDQHWISCSHDGPKILGSARSLARICRPRAMAFPAVFVLYGDILPQCSLAEVEEAFWASDRPVLMTCHATDDGNIWQDSVYAKSITNGARKDSGLIVGMTAVFESCGVYRDLEEVLAQLSERSEVAFHQVPRPYHIGTPAELAAVESAMAVSA